MTKPRKGNTVVTTTAPDTSMENLFDKLEKLEEKIATKECISKLMVRINDQKKTIAKMDDKIADLESHIDHLTKANADVY